MAWNYETMPLAVVHRLIELEQPHPDLKFLKETAKKAFEVAVYFEENRVDDEFVQKYLNNELPYHALSKLYLKSSVLHKDKGEDEDGNENDNDVEHVYSTSHKQWLNELKKAKNTWYWKHQDIDIETSQKNTLTSLMESFEKLQTLAWSYLDV